MNWTGINNFFWNILNRPRLIDVFDILVVAFLIYKLLLLTSGTRASQVLKGFILLVVGNWLSSALNLTSVNWVLETLLNNGTLVLMILFQPELRRALEQIGRRTKLFKANQQDKSDCQRIVSEINQCLQNLSRRRIGALLVFEQRTGLNDFIDTGVQLDSLISSGLLINIFEPNTPLHDGAIILRDNRIVSAACVLPLTEASNLSRELGTRHRAGIGITETTDAIVFIVSEETGIISVAQGGKLTRHLDIDAVDRILSKMYDDSDDSVWGTIKSFANKVASYMKEGRK
jgi:diadenylate cyclase